MKGKEYLEIRRKQDELLSQIDDSTPVDAPKIKELQRLNEQESKLIPYALITDNGKTVFHGIPTVTCLGIGPYASEELDKITGNLPLL